MKRIKIPLTIEQVGSEGKFFTDNMILKVIGVVAIDAFVSAIVFAQLSFRVPKILCLVLTALVFVILLYILTTNLIFNGRETIRALAKASEYQVLNTRHFNDIYEFIGNVALHNSGHCSVFVEILRGTTMGATDRELEDYYKALSNFENHLLQLGYSFKTVNLENQNFKEDSLLMNKQIYNAHNLNKTLERNLKLRYKYLKLFMEETIQADRTIYTIIDITDDTREFESRILQLVNSCTSKLIKRIHIMNSEEIINYSTEFFDTKLTDNKVIVESNDLFNIIEVNKEEIK